VIVIEPELCWYSYILHVYLSTKCLEGNTAHYYILWIFHNDLNSITHLWTKMTPERVEGKLKKLGFPFIHCERNLGD
jgi:hypothetical protein